MTGGVPRFVIVYGMTSAGGMCVYAGIAIRHHIMSSRDVKGEKPNEGTVGAMADGLHLIR